MTEMNIGIVSKTVDPITLFVRENGNDTNAGTNEDEALATIQAAIDRIPHFVTHDVVIDVGLGIFAGFLLSSRIVDRDKGTILIRGLLGVPTLSSGSTSGTATAGSTTSLEDALQTWTLNELRGRLLKVTFEDTIEYRVVRDNTATSIQLANSFRQSCAGRTYELLEQKTVIRKAALADTACIEVRNMVCRSRGYTVQDFVVEVDEDSIGVLGNDTDGGYFERLHTKSGRYGFSFMRMAQVRPLDLFAEHASEHGLLFTEGVNLLIYTRLYALGGGMNGGIFINAMHIWTLDACADGCAGPGIFIWGGLEGNGDCIYARDNAGSGLKVFGGQAWFDVDYGALENNGRYGVEIDGYAIDDDPSSGRGSGSCVNMMANLIIAGNKLGGIIGHQASNIHLGNVRGLNGGFGVSLEHGSKATIDGSTAVTGELGDATMNGGSSVLSWRNDFSADGDSKAEPNTLCLISRIGKSLVVENLLANPGFETGELTPDWQHLTDPAGATTTIDGAVAHGGTYSVKVVFSGTEDVNYFHVTQNVAVVADATYRLRGYIHTLDLTTDSGMRLEVQDARGESYFTTATESINGTTNWSYVDTTFTVPEETTEIKVGLRRRSGSGPISGTAWVDDISLYRVG